MAADPEGWRVADGLGPGRSWGWALATVLSPITPPMNPASAAGTSGLPVSARATWPPGSRASTRVTPKVLLHLGRRPGHPNQEAIR